MRQRDMQDSRKLEEEMLGGGGQKDKRLIPSINPTSTQIPA